MPEYRPSNDSNSPEFRAPRGFPVSSDRFDPAASGEKYLVFQIADGSFAVPARSVTEVVQPPPITALPNSPAWLLGLANLRGEILALFDLQRTLGKPAVPLTPKSRLIVFRPPGFDSPAAFLVDRIAEIVQLPANSVAPVDEEFLIGRTGPALSSIAVIDIAAIFAAGTAQ